MGNFIYNRKKIGVEQEEINERKRQNKEDKLTLDDCWVKNTTVDSSILKLSLAPKAVAATDDFHKCPKTRRHNSSNKTITENSSKTNQSSASSASRSGHLQSDRWSLRSIESDGASDKFPALPLGKCNRYVNFMYSDLL